MARSDKTSTKKPWPEIELFGDVNLPSFPTHVLPRVLREWVEAESRSIQTPEDLAGLLAVAVCAATVAGRVTVEPRADWFEPVNLFVAVLLESGNRKSRIFKDALKPLKEVEAALIAESRDVIAREQSIRRQDEARLNRLEKAASEEEPDLREQATRLAEELERRRVAVTPRLIIDDATTEKVVIVLSEQQGRIASMSPEGGVFDLMAGMYSKTGAPQFDVYLKGHAGDDLVTDRVSRGSVRVARPALTCAYAIQPQVIKGLADKKAFRGRGLLGRFLYAVPESRIGQREIGAAPIPPSVRESYHETVQSLAATKSEAALGLRSDALTMFEQWEGEIEDMLADGGEMELVRDWGAKLAGATLRLAGVLHCVEHCPDGQINAKTVSAAIELARYLIPHAVHTLSMMEARENSDDENAIYLLKWIQKGEYQDFTKREAQQQRRNRFPTAGDIDPVLKCLTKRGYIRPAAAQKPRAGRPSEPYEVNPALRVNQTPRKRSQYSQNSATDSETSSSEYFEDDLASSPKQTESTLGDSREASPAPSPDAQIVSELTPRSRDEH